MNLFLAILANVAVFAMFRWMPRFGATTFHAIVVNYWVCVLTGLLFMGSQAPWHQITLSAPWLPWAVLLVVLFIATFILMAHTTQQFSMTVATLSFKMALVIPVLMSLLVFQSQAKTYDGWNYLGIALAFPAIALTSLAPRSGPAKSTLQRRWVWMPFVLFALGGIIDTLINFLNLHYITHDFSSLFTILLFMGTGTIGIAILLIKRELPNRRSILAGVLLGIPNYFSIYLILSALADFNNDGALFFPLLNLGIILGSALAGMLLFGERFGRYKVIGLLLATLAIALLAYQELAQWLQP